MVADFCAYLHALLPNWWWLMGVGPLGIDPILRSVWPSYTAWADREWPLKRRAKIFRGVAFACIFVAGFMAFREEKAKLDLVNKNIEAAHHEDYLPYDPIPQDKIDAFVQMLREHGKHPVAEIAAVGDPSTTAILEQIRDAFERAGLEMPFVGGGRDSDKDFGIHLFVHDQKVLQKRYNFISRPWVCWGSPSR